MMEETDLNIFGGTEESNGAEVMLRALQEVGVQYIFSNLGSDHATFIEEMALAKQRSEEFPAFIQCPHESVALSAAQGYAQATGKPQAVFVHIDVGTLNLGGALHNVYRARIPVLIFAGDTPFTTEGELAGSRNTPINYLQDVYDQRGILRQYVKWEYEIKTGRNVRQLIFRAMQLAQSDPQGPVYLMGAREVLEEKIPAPTVEYNGWQPIEPMALSQEALELLTKDLLAAERPVLITSSIGRRKEAVDELVTFCEKLAIPVIEVRPDYMNFPADSPLHLGFNVEPIIKNVDLALVIDCDVPWIPNKVVPSDKCNIYYLDVDPLKEEIPVWYIPSKKFFRVDSLVALKQINNYIKNEYIDLDKKEERFQYFAQIHKQQRLQWKEEAASNIDKVITSSFLVATLEKVIDKNTIVLNETVTDELTVNKHIIRTEPGTYFTNPGTSLGWNGGASLGVKLACQNQTVVNLTGDGSFLFSVPSSVHWMSRRYKLPFLTIVFNNMGWNATKLNVLRLHPEGAAKSEDTYWVDFEPSANYSKIAEASGGAYAESVKDPAFLEQALINGMNAIKSGKSAVIEVYLKPTSD